MAAVGVAGVLPMATQETDSLGTARWKAWETHRQLADSSPFRDLAWQTLGPKFVGGRIESIDAPRGDRSTLYVGVGAGGIFKSQNGGLTWRPIFDQESTFAIGDLTIAPSNPNTIWVGTGECHLSRTSYAGNGVYKSLDAGVTWLHQGLSDSDHIGKVAVDPEDENLVYVAAMGRMGGGGQRGIYKTSDGGETFHCVLQAGLRTAFVELVIDPHDPRRLYAASWDRSGKGTSSIYRSDDRGETWKRLQGGLLEQQVDRIAIDAAASQAGVVYALMADASSPELARRGPAAVLFRSDDHGETWTRTCPEYVPTYIGWDFCDLRVAPDDANRLYIGGLRLIVSPDGGRSFVGEGGFAINQNPEEVFRLHPHRGIGMHLDVHDIWIDPEDPQRVMLGNDGGLYVSWDQGTTWLHLNNLPIGEFYRVYVDQQNPFRIWGGTQDNASLVAPSTARFEPGVDDAWQQVFLDPWSGGDGFSTFPDPHDPEITYYTQQNGALSRSRLGRLRTAKRIRPRAGNTTRFRMDATDETEPQAKSTDPTEFRFDWDTPFFHSVHGQQTVLYCAAQCVLKSVDRGDHWEVISPDLASRGLLALAESPIDANRLAAGGGRGQIHLTADGGQTWTAAAKLPHQTVRDIQLSAHDPQRLYVALSGKQNHDLQPHVFVSDDFGASWNDLANNLPGEPVNALIEDPIHEQLLFLGTDLGVYCSTNAGQVWHSLSQSLPTTAVVDLALQSRDGQLVAATHGLSMFLLDIRPIRDQIQQHAPGKQTR